MSENGDIQPALREAEWKAASSPHFYQPRVNQAHEEWFRLEGGFGMRTVLLPPRTEADR